MKFCKHCNIEHPLTPEFWYFLGGKVHYCKEWKRQYTRVTSHRYIESRAKYNLKNKDRIKEYNANYIRKLTDEQKVARAVGSRKSQERNREYYRNYCKEYYEKNKALISEKARLKYQAKKNKECK